MNRDGAIGFLRRTSFASGRVRQVAVPPTARALCTLAGVDYEDAFLVDIGPVQDRTAEQWSRAIFEDATVIMQSALRRGWRERATLRSTEM